MIESPPPPVLRLPLSGPRGRPNAASATGCASREEGPTSASSSPAEPVSLGAGASRRVVSAGCRREPLLPTPSRASPE
eukprot:2565234-Pyramimonas_sp.AAC.1